MKNTVNIILVDDHPLFLKALKEVLSDISFVNVQATFTNPNFVLPYLSQNKIDIVITDLEMPEMHGIDLVGKIKKNYPESKIVVISMINKAFTTQKLQEEGISAYLLKNATKEEYEKMFQIVLNNENFFSSEILQELRETKALKPVKLTKRELQILLLIADEFTMQEIANQLFVSQTTIISHRKRLMQKLQAKNTAGLIRKAFEQNLI